MEKVKLLTVIVSLLLVSNFAMAEGFKPGSEPDGFRGIRWGTDIRTLSGMKRLRIRRSGLFQEIYTYTRKGDKLVIGSAKIETIKYDFWRGKFCDVWIYTKGYVNWCALKDAIFKKFGRGRKLELSGEEEYEWIGRKTRMLLDYDCIRKVGLLRICSRKILKQMAREEKSEESDF